MSSSSPSVFMPFLSDTYLDGKNRESGGILDVREGLGSLELELPLDLILGGGVGRDSRELTAKKEAVAEDELAVKFVLAALSTLLLGDILANCKGGGGVGESEQVNGEPKKAAVLLPLEFAMLAE